MLGVGCLSFLLFGDCFLVLLWQAELLLGLLIWEMLRHPES
jgi:hypothetical protein